MAHFDDIILSDNMLVGPSSVSVADDGFDLRTNARIRQFVRLSAVQHRTFTISKLRDVATFYSEITNLFNLVGRADSFLGKDATDWNSTAGNMLFGTSLWTALDQPLWNATAGTIQGDGSTTVFDLIKRYADGSGSRDRRIVKPFSAGFLVGLGGVPTGAYTLDVAEGRVTYTVAPGAGVNVTWGGAYWVPMHFSGDLNHTLNAYDATGGEPVFEEAHLAIV